MRVFVWKSCGCTDVYAVETKEQALRLFNEICEVIKDWELKGLKDQKAYAKKHPDLDGLIKSIGFVLNLIGVGIDTEDFEDGTGFVEVKE